MKVFPALAFLADLLPKHNPHEYSEEMKCKSEVITMPVLMKDEKFAECVEEMNTFEDCLQDIHTKVLNVPADQHP